VNVPGWARAAFAALVVAMPALDMFVPHRRAHEVSLREAGAWSTAWVAIGLTADLYHVPAWASPVFIAAVLAVVISIRSPHRTHLRSNPAGFH
jgi:tellurite resistance protein TerC